MYYSFLEKFIVPYIMSTPSDKFFINFLSDLYEERRANPNKYNVRNFWMFLKTRNGMEKKIVGLIKEVFGIDQRWKIKRTNVVSSYL